MRAARSADKLLESALERGNERWVRLLEPMPDKLRDAGLAELRSTAVKARAAYGPKDSIREALPADRTEPFITDLDKLLKALAREAANR